MLPLIPSGLHRRFLRNVGVILLLAGMTVWLWAVARCSAAGSGPAELPEVSTSNLELGSVFAHASAVATIRVHAEAELSAWHGIVASALDHPDPAVRLEAISRLGEAGDLLSLQVLEHALYDTERRVRAAAIDALSMNLSLGIQDILLRALANDDGRIRNLAYDLLEELRAENQNS
jgi:HEAT repeat protein